MRIELVTITESQKLRRSEANSLVAEYVGRIAKSCPCTLHSLRSEERLLEFMEKSSSRTRPALILTDSLGKQLSSVEFAEAVGELRDSGRQQLIFAVGPADGWSAAMRQRADLVLAFGRITLPHELAAVVLAEQVYRALTILAGHPYHMGH